MLRNKLVRSDGSIIDSSVIVSCEFTEEVNSGENLSVGDVTSSEINVEILSTVMVEHGEVFTYYMVEDGVENLIGIFNADKPRIASRTSIKFSAFDNVVKSEKLFSGWLRDNQNLFPMTLGELVTHACEYCGVTLITPAFPQSDIEINAFYADGITCRQILAWASTIAGRFVRANQYGEIEFAWYKDATNFTIAPSAVDAANSVSVTDDGEGNVSVMSDIATVDDDGDGNVSVELPYVKVLYNNGVVTLGVERTVPYKQDSLSLEAYTTDIIKRVQIKQTGDDVGVIYPASATGNCFVISENMILATCSTAVITSVARRLYDQLSTISYVPVRATLPRTIVIRAGDIINVRDPRGTEIVTYVMKMSVTASGTSIESTGDKSYDTNAAVSSEKYTNLTGKVLESKQNIDGLKVENRDLHDKVASLELSTEEFKTYVSQTYAREDELGSYHQDVTSQITQTAENIEAYVDETYVRDDEFGAYKTSVSTQFEQTSDAFEMKFQSTSSAIDAVDKDLQAKYNERTSYIRFEDGNIILGRAESDIILIQKNDRISFVRNVQGLPEVAWFADDVLHVTEGQFTVQLGIGKFGFKPGENGNLSFRKVLT